MRAAMIGTGCVGLVLGLWFVDFGHLAARIDNDLRKIVRLEQGKISIFGSGPNDLVARNVRAVRFFGPLNLARATKRAYISTATVDNGAGPIVGFTILSGPEFPREGAAIQCDFRNA